VAVFVLYPFHTTHKGNIIYKFRMMSILVILAMLFSFGNVSPAGAASANLTVNGSFEDPQLPVGGTT
jgi:hypothetical protein